MTQLLIALFALRENERYPQRSRPAEFKVLADSFVAPRARIAAHNS
jgi:hypothetical protein